MAGAASAGGRRRCSVGGSAGGQAQLLLDARVPSVTGCAVCILLKGMTVQLLKN